MIAKERCNKILVLHGPNLNLQGEREPGVYGAITLPRINAKILAYAKANKVLLRIFQSNWEGKLIDILHQNRRWAQGVVFNPAAFTHYSYALRDAIVAIGIPTVEVHLSDIKKREPFRKISVIAPVCRAQIRGHGVGSYLKGIDILLNDRRIRGRR